MRAIVASIEGEYRRYRCLGSGTMDQLSAHELRTPAAPSSNSVATLVWHISGNLASRFTDFLSSDGEKPWRAREEEFALREATAEEVDAKWKEGWAILMETLAGLTDSDLDRHITIRGVPLTVIEALHRSLAHTSYHVGQMTFVGKQVRGVDWISLSIPPGGTAAYNENPTREKG